MRYLIFVATGMLPRGECFAEISEGILALSRVSGGIGGDLLMREELLLTEVVATVVGKENPGQSLFLHSSGKDRVPRVVRLSRDPCDNCELAGGGCVHLQEGSDIFAGKIPDCMVVIGGSWKNSRTPASCTRRPRWAGNC